jgi:hypothetical protein
VREEKQGVTDLVARGYEIALWDHAALRQWHPLSGKGPTRRELNQRLVIRDAQARPVAMSGYVQGLAEISDSTGVVIFRGRYYDSRPIQSLAGDDALTPTGQAVVDHWENGFGEGAYAGHAFSVGVQLTREGDRPLRGEGRGQIEWVHPELSFQLQRLANP